MTHYQPEILDLILHFIIPENMRFSRNRPGAGNNVAQEQGETRTPPIYFSMD
jgi:hypothetical protein